MFQFHIISLFPEIFESLLSTSLLGKALESGLIQVHQTDPRQFTSDRHHTVDDVPFGGGDGMVMKPDPVVDALEALPAGTHRVLLTPQGEPLNQRHLHAWLSLGQLALVCGRYEGFDERIRSHVHQEISLGDFVMCGGEVAAMAILEGVSRLVPGVIGNMGSLTDESHREGLLEYPQYTRPRVFRGEQVPEVLIQGNHQDIRRWRRRMQIERTRRRRPDLFRRFQPGPDDLPLLDGLQGSPGAVARRTYLALLHHPVRDRLGRLVTTAVTNLDIHDIARSSRTFGLAGYFLVTPLASQQELIARILAHWQSGHGARANRLRSEALALAQVASDLDMVKATIAQQQGREPLVVGTTAVPRPDQALPEEVIGELEEGQPLLLLFGTGWGLSDELLASCDRLLRPIGDAAGYNHLSVRSAAAIMLDRLFGLRQ